MNKKFNILCFLDDDHGRDAEILMPVVYYVERFLDAKVEFAFIWEMHKIYTRKPHVILLANTVGSLWHFQLSQYAAQNNIRVFALISEGNFRTDGTFNYWGYNTDKKYYQEYICHWSKRTLDFFNTVLPEYKERNVLTGATGFDRYKIYKFIPKEEYLEKKELSNFKKVIGYAGWAFGKQYNSTGKMEIVGAFKENAEARMKWMEEQMYLVEDILRKSIENNPDILFILKRHPNEKHPHLTQEDKNEMYNLRNYPNVLYITEHEDLHDLLNVSDIWTGFETTTTMEAWMMGNKQTVLINPDPDFKRDKLYKGSVIVKSYEEFQDKINEYYKTGTIEEFYQQEKKDNRIQLLIDTIGFYDGLNHVRAGYYLNKVLNTINIDEKIIVKFNFKYFVRYLLIHVGQLFYSKKLFLLLPKFKKTVWIFERFRLKYISYLKNKYFDFLDDFYEKTNLKENVKKESFLKEILTSNYNLNSNEYIRS